MAAMANFCIGVLFLSLFSQGFGQKCDFSNNIIVGTVRSGREIQGKLEWNVQVINNCTCAQGGILLNCKGFQSLEAIDPSIFRTVGDQCLVNDGRPIPPNASVNFSYAWEPPFILQPAASKVFC